MCLGMNWQAGRNAVSTWHSHSMHGHGDTHLARAAVDCLKQQAVSAVAALGCCRSNPTPPTLYPARAGVQGHAAGQHVRGGEVCARALAQGAGALPQRGRHPEVAAPHQHRAGARGATVLACAVLAMHQCAWPARECSAALCFPGPCSCWIQSRVAAMDSPWRSLVFWGLFGLDIHPPCKYCLLTEPKRARCFSPYFCASPCPVACTCTARACAC